MIKAAEQIMQDINFLCSIDEAFAESPDDVDKAVSYTHLTLPTICSV